MSVSVSVSTFVAAHGGRRGFQGANSIAESLDDGFELALVRFGSRPFLDRAREGRATVVELIFDAFSRSALFLGR